MEHHPPKAGRCAIVGRPNAGKSTLLNTLLGQKLAIATARPGTTRSCILGVYASETPPSQIAFIDTPGLHRPKSALGKVLIEQAKLGLSDADVILMITEVYNEQGNPQLHPEDLRVLELVKEIACPTVLALNKIDRLASTDLVLPWIDTWQSIYPFKAMIPISAKREHNLKALTTEIYRHIPEGTLYDKDFLTDKPVRFFSAELIREAAMNATRQEVPHGIACFVETFEDAAQLTKIHATLIVEKPSHKGIVLGSGGQRIKAIGIRAREEIEELLGRKVFLKLWVKVIPDWTKNPQEVKRLTNEIGHP